MLQIINIDNRHVNDGGNSTISSHDNIVTCDHNNTNPTNYVCFN